MEEESAYAAEKTRTHTPSRVYARAHVIKRMRKKSRGVGDGAWSRQMRVKQCLENGTLASSSSSMSR